MSRQPTPVSQLRLLVSTDASHGAAWAALRTAAFAHDACEVDGAGQRLFLFQQPLAALRFCLECLGEPRLAATRLAVHLDDVRLSETDGDWRERGAPRWLASGNGLGQLQRLLQDPGTPRLRFSKAAAELVKRAAVGSELAMLGWQPSRPGGEGAGWLSPRWQGDDGAGADGDATAMPAIPVALAADQPLPHRPHWWLVGEPSTRGQLHAWRLRQQKTGLCGHAWEARSESGLAELQARLDAQQQLSALGLAQVALAISDSHVQAPPYFIACQWLGVVPLQAGCSVQPATLGLIVPALAQLASGLATANRRGFAHGLLSTDDLFIGTGFGQPSLQIDGLRAYTAEALGSAVERDLQALAGVLFRLALGGLEREPGPFWESQIADPAVRALLRACLDPAHLAPIRSLEHFANALHRLTPSADDSTKAAAPRVPWWRR